MSSAGTIVQDGLEPVSIDKGSARSPPRTSAAPRARLLLLLPTCPPERRVLLITIFPSRVWPLAKMAEERKNSRRLCLLLVTLSGPSLAVEDELGGAADGREDRLVRKALSHASRRRDWRSATARFLQACNGSHGIVSVQHRRSC